MKTKTIELTLDDQPVKITAKRASIEDGINRFLMTSESIEQNKAEQNESRRIMRLILYPNLMTGTERVEGFPFPMPFEDFIALDEDIVNKWADLVYEVNPHWQLTTPSSDEGKKKTSKTK